jgi:hypothetical protein
MELGDILSKWGVAPGRLKSSTRYKLTMYHVQVHIMRKFREWYQIPPPFFVVADAQHKTRNEYLFLLPREGQYLRYYTLFAR